MKKMLPLKKLYL